MFDIQIGTIGILYPEDFDALKKVNGGWEMLQFSKMCVFKNTPVKVEVKMLTVWPTPLKVEAQEMVFVTPRRYGHLGIEWLSPTELFRRIDV
jgi:hypothetical protein